MQVLLDSLALRRLEVEASDDAATLRAPGEQVAGSGGQLRPAASRRMQPSPHSTANHRREACDFVHFYLPIRREFRALTTLRLQLQVCPPQPVPEAQEGGMGVLALPWVGHLLTGVGLRADCKDGMRLLRGRRALGFPRADAFLREMQRTALCTARSVATRGHP